MHTPDKTNLRKSFIRFGEINKSKESFVFKFFLDF